ncbi:unnamed protein product [Coffea canephora]|uniref:Peptidase M14 domain-containing protein n=1 Tax=Coffea canephora TaxID=49390 RepID=A0A068VCJ9_COFCA|nr:unnamed protein product [Coffea canephora]
MATQNNIVLACMALHNFMREYVPNDAYFAEEEADIALADNINPFNPMPAAQAPDMSTVGIAEWNEICTGLQVKSNKSLSFLAERGVDLNRNWSVDWGKNSPSCFVLFQDYDPYEENLGTAPFSEPETQFMQKLSISFEPHV